MWLGKSLTKENVQSRGWFNSTLTESAVWKHDSMNWLTTDTQLQVVVSHFLPQNGSGLRCVPHAFHYFRKTQNVYHPTGHFATLPKPGTFQSHKWEIISPFKKKKQTQKTKQKGCRAWCSILIESLSMCGRVLEFYKNNYLCIVCNDL